MKRIILSFITLMGLVLIPAAPLAGNAYAACGTPSTSKTQVLNGIGETGGDCSGSGVTKIISAAVNILSYVIGIAGVVMVVLGGFKYIVSGGESGKVANAKNTLIYALIGLIIAALAQFLVHFVLSATNNASAPSCPKGQHHASQTGTCIKN